MDQKELRRQQNKAYYEKYKEDKLKVTICECGGKFSDYTKKRHLQSKKHLRFIGVLPPPKCRTCGHCAGH